MQETRRASQISVEELKEVLECMDWTEIQKARIYSNPGSSVGLFTNGEYAVQGTQPASALVLDADGAYVVRDSHLYDEDEDRAGLIARLACWGRDPERLREYYESCCARPMGNGEYRVDPDYFFPHLRGRTISEERMIEEAVTMRGWSEGEVDAAIRLVLAGERNRLIRQADEQNPGCAGDWDGWTLGQIVRPVTTPLGRAFDPGDRVLVEPDRLSAMWSSASDTVAYSWRKRINASVGNADVEVLIWSLIW